MADNILTAIHLTDGRCYNYSDDKFGFDQEENADYLPKCMLLIWRNAEIQAELANPLAPVPEVAVPVSDTDNAVTASLEPDTDVTTENSSLCVKSRFTNYTLSPLLLIHNNDKNTEHEKSVRDSIRDVMMTSGFSATAGPEADYYRQPAARDKTLSNSSAGYAAWVGLRLNLFDEETVDDSAACDAVAAIKGLSFLELAFVRDFFRSTVRFFEPFMRDNGTAVGSFDLLF